MQTLLLRRNLILGLVLLFWVFAAFYISLFPLEYRAYTVISSPCNSGENHEAENLIRSDAFLKTVLVKLDLINSLEYNNPARPPKIANEFFRWLRDKTLPADISERILRQLKSSINVKCDPDNNIVLITKSAFPDMSVKLAHEISALFISQSSDAKNIKILKSAEKPAYASFDQYQNIVILATILGILTGSILAIIPRKQKN